MKLTFMFSLIGFLLVLPSHSAPDSGKNLDPLNLLIIPRSQIVAENALSTDSPTIHSLSIETPSTDTSIMDTLSTDAPITDPPCEEKRVEPRIGERGSFTVHYNYVPMDFVVCSETLTYTTHGDFRFFDNLEPLLQRWEAPISLAAYAPGRDFQATVESIKYARNCGSPLVKKFVTFHLYYDINHRPNQIPDTAEILDTTSYDCESTPPWKNPLFVSNTYRKEHHLLYAINVARNVARESAVTHYVLASDIELYPSPGLPSKFLRMINEANPSKLAEYDKKVYVLPTFEVEKGNLPPLNKTRLKTMIESGTAISFHQYACPDCHQIPRYNDWISMPETDGLHVLWSSRRRGKQYRWEPVYIGTNDEPEYDERLTWEGQSDKRIQGWILCALDYRFFILDNAFLVHRPGIKRWKYDPKKAIMIHKTDALIKNTIIPEYRKKYTKGEGCIA